MAPTAGATFRGALLAFAPLAIQPSHAQMHGENWPLCIEQARVLRHGGRHGIFLDLAHLVGAREGCWLGDCTKTDKFICNSPDECAAACSRVDPCRFWTYEVAAKKCLLRSSDALREENGGYVSGARECRPGAAPSTSLGPTAGKNKVAIPFARAALWAAELPALRPCDAGIQSPGCDNPYAAMGVWRYAVNNLRAAVARLPEHERQQHASTMQYIQQIALEVATFYRQPTAETFQTAVADCIAVFQALRGWLQGAPPSEIEVQDGSGAAPHLPGGRSMSLPSSGLVEARATFQDGNLMPLVGFGTWQLNGQAAYDATIAALKSGYRHIDTAQAYGNEQEVGLAIRDSGVPRNEIFVATKISDPSEYLMLEQRLETQLAAMGLEYLDLYMLHTPGDKEGVEAAWRTMENLQARGKVRSLGVSNFGTSELKELLAFARVKPVYLQNKFSIYNPGEQQVGSTSISAYAREHGIQVMGYSVINPWPFMLPPMEDPHIQSIASRYGRSPSQVLHRWALQLGAGVIPKSANPSRIVENARLFDFELSEVDMRLLNGIVALSECVIEAPLQPKWADDVYGIAL